MIVEGNTRHDVVKGRKIFTSGDTVVCVCLGLGGCCVWHGLPLWQCRLVSDVINAHPAPPTPPDALRTSVCGTRLRQRAAGCLGPLISCSVCSLLSFPRQTTLSSSFQCFLCLVSKDRTPRGDTERPIAFLFHQKHSRLSSTCRCSISAKAFHEGLHKLRGSLLPNFLPDR